MNKTTSESAIRKHFPAFAKKLRDRAVCRIKPRLLAGAQQYGDVSFNRYLSELFDEISEELLDVGGWGFIAWCRLLSMKLLTTGSEKKRIEDFQNEIVAVSQESLLLFHRIEVLKDAVSQWELKTPE